VAGDEVAFGEVRVAGEDEGRHSGVADFADLARDLAGVTDDGDACTTAGATDASPQMTLDVALGVG